MTRVSRRSVLGVLGAAGATGLVEGTTEDGTTVDEQGGGTTDAGTAAATTQSKQVVTAGTVTAPDSLNVLEAASTAELATFDPIYDPGVVRHPTTQAVHPWLFESWTVTPGNVGTSNPTIVATLRDDVSFTDGVALTAEDVKFTVEYVKSQSPSGAITADRFSAVSSVEVDDPEGTTVDFFLSSTDPRWADDILGTPILPKHVWKDFSDHTNYTRSSGGPIGSGAFVLDDFDLGNYFSFVPRTDVGTTYPLPGSAGFLDDGAPFVDELRIEVFGSRSAVVDALFSGTIDVPLSSVGTGDATRAQRSDDVRLQQSDTDGWKSYLFNVRRVPFDDVAFRQLLVKVFDHDHVVDAVYDGVGAEEGTYATPRAYPEYRPPEPTEIDDFEGISIPDLTFPGTAGTFDLGSDGVQEARDFIINHPSAKHDYSVGVAETDLTTAPDGQELYVNGQHLTEAHTNNAGTAGQGPLTVRFSYPHHDPTTARVTAWWLGVLNRIGIPVEAEIRDADTRTLTVFKKEEFDVVAVTRDDIGPVNDHYEDFYHSTNADFSNDDTTTASNPMGYTSADSYIDAVTGEMDSTARKSAAKKVLAELWHDAPVLVGTHDTALQPTAAELAGWVGQVGGVANRFSWLNVHTTTTPPALPGFSNPPKDLDGDRRFEDLTGDGVFDVGDVQALYDNLDSSAVQDNVDAFDFDGNGIVDVGDVRALYEELQSRG